MDVVNPRFAELMGASESSPEVASFEQALPDYKPVSHIGSGAFGNVWKCLKRSESSNSTKFLAIKQINSDLTTDECLLNEIACMRKLRAQCPNFVILQGFRFDETLPHAYLIMEYCDGGDLDIYLRKHKKLRERSVQVVFRQIGQAMAVMLQHPVIHRDIKPQNILLCKSDPTATEVDLFNCTVKLADFGVAKMAARASTTVCGTFDYMAPEVIRCLAERRESYDAKCDMFSVGVVLHQCMTGKLPFSRPTMLFGQTTGDLTSIANGDDYQAPTLCSPEVQALLKQLLMADPSERLGADQFLKHFWFTLTFDSPAVKVADRTSLQTRAGRNLFNERDRDQNSRDSETESRPALSQTWRPKVKVAKRLADVSDKQRFLLLLLGAGNVGKKAVLERFVKDRFSYGQSGWPFLYGDYIKNVEQSTKAILEAAIMPLRPPGGVDTTLCNPFAWFRGAHAVIILYDVTDWNSFQKYKTWMRMVRNLMDQRVPIILVGCKADLSNQRKVFLEEAHEAAGTERMLFATETSAKTGSGVLELFTRIGKFYMEM